MQQIQALIDRIRAALADERIEKSNEMVALSKDFQEITRKINERLRRCGEYLRQGLRVEAIQEAETDPRLIEAVGVVQGLTDDEWKRWQELAQFLELPLSEPPLHDVAQMIDEAYSEHAPLESLLRQYRKLALQRAPLAQRVAHLRQLALNDPNTEIWQTDLRAYEEARLAQIVQVARTGARGASLVECQNLLAEVQDVPWTIALPPKLVPTLQSQVREAERKDARSRLGQIFEKLQAAYAAEDFAQATTPYREWTKFFPLAALPADDPLVRGSRDAVAWCEERTAAESDDSAWSEHLTEVHRALGRSHTSEEALRQLADQTDALGRTLPFDVESQLLERIDSFRTNRTRKRLLIGGIASLVETALVVLVTVSVTGATGASIRKDAIAEIDKALETGDVPMAVGVRLQYEPKYFSDNKDWKAACLRIDEMKGSLESRSKEIEKLLNQADEVPAEDGARFNQLLTKAEGIAKQPPAMDKDAIDERVKPVIDKRRKLMEVWNKEIASKMEGHKDSLEDLKETHKTLSPQASSDKLNQLRKDVRQTTEGLNGVAEPILKAQAEILAAIDSMERAMIMAGKRKQLLSELNAKSRIRSTPEGVSEVKTFTGLLLAFSTELKDDPLAAAMKQASAEAELWASLFAVRKFPQEFGRLFPESVDLIGARRNEANEFLKAFPRTPLAEGAQSYLKALAVVESRIDPKAGLIAQLKGNILDAAYMRDLEIVREKGRPAPFYLISGTASSKSDRVEFTSWSAVGNPATIILAPSKLDIAKPKAAPQLKLAKKMQDELDGISIESWDLTMSRLAKAIINDKEDREDPPVDAILRLTLLRDMCDLTKAGSLSAATHKPFLDFESKLSSTVERINLRTDWADPRSEEVAQRRARCLEYLTEIASIDFDRVWPTSTNVLKDLQNELVTQYSGVGWMTYDEDGKPMIDATTGSGSGSLLVMLPGASEAAAGRFETIGRYDGSRPRWLPTAKTTYFLPGRLVFARPASATYPAPAVPN